MCCVCLGQKKVVCRNLLGVRSKYCCNDHILYLLYGLVYEGQGCFQPLSVVKQHSLTLLPSSISTVTIIASKGIPFLDGLEDIKVTNERFVSKFC